MNAHFIYAADSTSSLAKSNKKLQQKKKAWLLQGENQWDDRVNIEKVDLIQFACEGKLKCKIYCSSSECITKDIV